MKKNWLYGLLIAFALVLLWRIPSLVMKNKLENAIERLEESGKLDSALTSFDTGDSNIHEEFPHSNRYHDDNRMFSIEFPIGWEIKEAIYSEDIVIKARTKRGSNIANIMVYLWPLSQEEQEYFDNESASSLFEKSYTEEYGNRANLYDSGSEFVNGNHSKWMDFDFIESDGLKRRCLGYYILDNDQIFWILGMTIGEDAKWNSSSMEQIRKSIQSFKIDANG